jgi:hypothetical protein
MRMIRLRNALSKLIRVNRSRARAPDSIVPFIRIVKDQPCPYCGSKFPNRPKVHDGEGWWWRCYTEDCIVQYYLPERRVAILRTGERLSYGELIRRYKRGIFKVRTWMSLLMK